MIFKENYIYAGKILKTHGYQGELVVVLEDFAKETFKKKGPVFVEIDGICVPFFIEYLEESGNRFILKLDDINTDYDAEEYPGLKLFVVDKNNKSSSKPFGMNELIGFRFEDTCSGLKGKVKEIVEIPGNPLLKIETGKQEFLVPFNNKLVIRMNSKENLLVMKLPEGLLD